GGDPRVDAGEVPRSRAVRDDETRGPAARRKGGWPSDRGAPLVRRIRQGALERATLASLTTLLRRQLVCRQLLSGGQRIGGRDLHVRLHANAFPIGLGDRVDRAG